MAQDPEVFNARFEAFMRYKITLIEQVHDHVASAIPTRYILMSKKETNARPFNLNAKIFDGKEEENLLLWTRYIETAMGTAMVWRSHIELDCSFLNSVVIQKLGTHVTCGRKCCVSLMGFTQGSDVSCVRTA